MAAAQLKQDGSLVRLAKVDATVHRKLADDYLIKSYPTLKFFKNGNELYDYNGPRHAQSIVNWLKEQSKSPTFFSRFCQNIGLNFVTGYFHDFYNFVKIYDSPKNRKILWEHFLFIATFFGSIFYYFRNFRHA